MRSFSQISEKLGDTAIFTFGRFNPPTTGHEKLIDALAREQSKNTGSKMYVFPSQSQNPKKDPLPFALKVAYMRKMFPKYAKNIMANKKVKMVFDIAVDLHNKGHRSIIMVVGSDRVTEFDTLLNKYNGVNGRHGYYGFDNIEVVSAGERDPDAEGVTGMSASKMRAAAVDGDFDTFKMGVPSGFKDALKLYNDVRKNMGIREERDMGEMTDFESLRDLYLTGKLWNIGDIVEAHGVKGKVINKGTNYLSFVDENNKVHKTWLYDIVERDYKKEYANYQGTPEQIARRSSRNKARRIMGDKAVKGMDVGHKDNNPMNNDPSNLRNEDPSDNRREPRLREVKQDKQIKDREGTQPAKYYAKDTEGDTMAKSTKQARARHFDKKKKGPAPGDASATTKPSKHTQKFKQMYGEARAKNAVAGGKVQKLVTAHGLKFKGKVYKEIDMELKKIDNSTEMVTFNIIHPREIFGNEVKIPFKTLRRGPFMATDTSKVNEVLGKNADMGDYIDDFQKSDAPQFKGKSKEKRKDMAIAAYLDKKDKNEEVDMDIYHLDEKIEGLVTKAKKSGMPYGILKKVYDRGMAAYKTGHRPGTTAQQWAFARVNSFVTKSSGTWGKADKDLADKVRASEEVELDEAMSAIVRVMRKNKKLIDNELGASHKDYKAYIIIDEDYLDRLNEFQAQLIFDHLKKHKGVAYPENDITVYFKSEKNAEGFLKDMIWFKRSFGRLDINLTPLGRGIKQEAELGMIPKKKRKGHEVLGPESVNEWFESNQTRASYQLRHGEDWWWKLNEVHDAMLEKTGACCDDCAEGLTEAKFEVNFSKGGNLYSVSINAKNEDDAEEKVIKKHKIDADDIRTVAKESTELKEKGPCWDGFKQVGMKMKGGKEVPNCVPESWTQEDIDENLRKVKGTDNLYEPKKMTKFARTKSMIDYLKTRDKKDAEKRKKDKNTSDYKMRMFNQMENIWGEITEKDDKSGKELNNPTRGDVKKYKVYVKNDKGNVVKVEFGDPNMSIKRDDPERRKSFRARHNCENPGPKWKARYWSCKFWSTKSVTDLMKG